MENSWRFFKSTLYCCSGLHRM